MPVKIVRYAVVEPTSKQGTHVVAIHRDKEMAEELIHGNRVLVPLVGEYNPPDLPDKYWDHLACQYVSKTPQKSKAINHV